MQLLMETEYDCARSQVHILQIVSMQLLFAHDIIALQWPVRNTFDYFISFISLQISIRREHSAIIVLFCAYQQAAQILNEYVKWTML